MKTATKNRWVILAASIICNLCIGSVYAWSVFQKPLMNLFHWAPKEVSLTFTIIIIMMPLSMISAGKIMNIRGPTSTMVLGGILFGAGVFLASYSTSLSFLYIVHGVIAGLGVGAVYGCAMSTTVKWFPDKKGLASGLIAAGLGFGAVVFAPLANYLIGVWGVLTTFKILGVIYLVSIVGCALIVEAPPSDYKVAGAPIATPAVGVSGVDKNWREMLTDPMFYVLWLMYTAGAVSGLMIIGHASPIGQEVMKLSATTAAYVVSIIALANTGGRVFWGYISDKAGRYPALAAIYLLSALMMFLLNVIDSYFLFLIVTSIIGLCYGGLLGIFPTVTADLFGLKNLGENYGIMFSALAAAAVIGPPLAAQVKEMNGNYDQAFWIAGLMASVGVIMTLFVWYQLKKRQGNT